MKTNTSTLPWQAIAVIVISLLMIIRVTAVNRINDLGADEFFWLYPVTIDILVAICAPFIAYSLWKRTGIGPWAFALVFHVVALQDATVGLLFEVMIPMSSRGTSVADVISLTVIALLSAVAIGLLSQAAVRTRYTI